MPSWSSRRGPVLLAFAFLLCAASFGSLATCYRTAAQVPSLTNNGEASLSTKSFNTRVLLTEEDTEEVADEAAADTTEESQDIAGTSSIEEEEETVMMEAEVAADETADTADTTTTTTEPAAAAVDTPSSPSSVNEDEDDAATMEEVEMPDVVAIAADVAEDLAIEEEVLEQVEDAIVDSGASTSEEDPLDVAISVGGDADASGADGEDATDLLPEETNQEDTAAGMADDLVENLVEDGSGTDGPDGGDGEDGEDGGLAVAIDGNAVADGGDGGAGLDGVAGEDASSVEVAGAVGSGVADGGDGGNGGDGGEGGMGGFGIAVTTDESMPVYASAAGGDGGDGGFGAAGGDGADAQVGNAVGEASADGGDGGFGGDAGSGGEGGYSSVALVEEEEEVTEDAEIVEQIVSLFNLLGGSFLGDVAVALDGGDASTDIPEDMDSADEAEMMVVINSETEEGNALANDLVDTLIGLDFIWDWLVVGVDGLDATVDVPNEETEAGPTQPRPAFADGGSGGDGGAGGDGGMAGFAFTFGDYASAQGGNGGFGGLPGAGACGGVEVGNPVDGQEPCIPEDDLWTRLRARIPQERECEGIVYLLGLNCIILDIIDQST